MVSMKQEQQEQQDSQGKRMSERRRHLRRGWDILDIRVRQKPRTG